MSRHGRIYIIPHPKAEPDLDQIVLGVLAALDELAADPVMPVAELEPARPNSDESVEDLPERRAS